MSRVNEKVLDQLLSSHEAGRLAHAYLFAGVEGVGKFATATALAQRVNCLKPGLHGMPRALACDCVSCRQIAAGNHPDVLVVERLVDKAGIGIEQVRWVIERLELRALQARVKFVLVKDADFLHEAAANAFLKTLEEPRAGTILILTTALPESILSTMRSRCQQVSFESMPQGALEDLLKKEHGMPAEDAFILAAFAQGSPGLAGSLGEDFIVRRRVVLDAFFSSADVEGFVKAVGGDRDAAREALWIILMALRDALLIRSGASGSVVNRDRQVEIRRFAQRHAPQELSAQADLVKDAFRRIEGNQNVKMVLTVIKEFTSS